MKPKQRMAALLGAAALLAGASGVLAADDADARFRGAPTYDLAVTNVKWEAATEQYSYVTFDLSWSCSWRAAWVEDGTNNVTGAALKLENWDAAWVFVKFLAEKNKKSSIERNYWRHATLSTDAVHHGMPAGATNSVGLTDDGRKGIGAFIYRDAIGHGTNNFRGVKLRWLHGADKVDPGKAALAVHPIAMVYVPEGPFKSRSPWGNPLTLINTGNATKAGGYRIGGKAPENDTWPNGYRAFYCMKRSISQGQYAEFLNSVAGDLAAARYNAARYDVLPPDAAKRYSAKLYNLNGYTIHVVNGVYTADVPDRACNFLSWPDILSYTAWAGLRPITDLEYEKACRGPRKPVANEFAWGTAGIAKEEYTLANEGKADERIAENYSTTAGNANYDFTMPAFHGGAARGGVSAVPGSPMRAGIFATPGSGRVAAGASYWGIMELSGNVREQVVTVGHLKGRRFAGTHGAGTLGVPKDWPEAKYSAGAGQTSGKDDAIGSGLRGGFFGDRPFGLRTSDRGHAAYRERAAAFSERARQDENGWRGVRAAP